MQNTGSNACIMISNTTTIGERSTYLAPCNNASAYSDAGNLNLYAGSLQNAITPILTSLDIFTTYPTSYFAYYVALKQYLTPSVMAQISSFITPYNQL